MSEPLPSFLRFRPVPVRARHDGWTPAIQRRFILLLGRGSPPAEAARRAGRSRQTAYALRRLVGFVQLEDHKGALRKLARLDRVAARMDEEAAGFDFDAYLEILSAGAEADKVDRMRV